MGFSNKLLGIEEYQEYISSLKKIRNKDLEILLENLNDENKKRFYYGYLPRVVEYAKVIYQKYQEYCVDYYSLMDLIQEGNLLLWDILNTDEISKFISKMRLFNYAFYSRLTRKMLESFIVKKSFCFVDDFQKLLDGENNFYLEYGYWPFDNELAKYTGMSLRKINNLRAIFQKEISLYSREVLNIQEDELMEDVVINKMYNETLCNEIINSFFKNEEREVLLLRLGINYDEKKNEVSYVDKMTIEEIGTRYDHTKEWARQTYKKALEKAPYLKSIRSVYK